MLFLHLGKPDDEWCLAMEKEKQNEGQEFGEYGKSMEHFLLDLP